MAGADLERCRGWVERIFFASPGFCAGRLRTEAGEAVEFAGPVVVRAHDAVVLEGAWSVHPRYGRQFRVERALHGLPLEVDGLAQYLARHPAIRGVGPVKARRIAERFGAELEAVLEHDPERIAREIHLSAESVQQLRDVWARGAGKHRALTELAAFGLTHWQTQTLVERLGPGALQILQADPYRLLHEIAGFGFKRLDAIALRLGTAADFAGRIRAGIGHCLDEALADGDCWLEWPALVQRAHQLLGFDVADGFERIDEELAALTAEGALLRAQQGESSLVSRPEVDAMERELAGFLAAACERNPHFGSLGDADLAALVSAASCGAATAATAASAPALPALSADQQRAVQLALRHSVALLCGGAGTGKTRTVAALAALCEQRGLDVVLAAPTGKASKRLEEVTGREAVTLHRLLGFNGRFYLRGPDDPVAADVLIVDEVSMVDLVLAWQLFRSLDLRRTAVLLVGDHNQLPPVGPGNPLRDLIAERALPTVILEAIVRQAGVLKANSLAVLSGAIAPDGGPWRVCADWVQPAKAQRFALDLFESLLAEGAAERSAIQVLTPMHRGPLGTGELNQALQRLVQRKLFGVEVGAAAAGEPPRFLLHDRVIQTRNDYDLGVMNGAIGIVRDADPGGSLRVEFEGKIVELEPRTPSRQQLQLAYALTIHKSQGSEFSCVLVIVHRAHAFMHHRNLLYTAVTRARDRVFLIGDRLALESCARKQRSDRRRTLLGSRLQALARRSASAGAARAF